MDENRRVAYLKQMGIPVWYAMRPLQGALDTPLSDPVLAPEYANTEVETLNTIGDVNNINALQKPALQSTAAQAGQIIKISEESLSPKVVSKAPIKNDAPDSALLTSKLNHSPQLHFSFAKIPLANGVLVLAELGDENAPGFSANETRLLTAIFSALDVYPLSQEGLDSQRVKWPQLNVKGMQSDAQAAGDFLFAYLEAQQQRSNFNALLLLGDSLRKALLGAPGADGLRLKESRVITSCSLMTMLQQPREKSVLWHKIKHLIKSDLRD